MPAAPFDNLETVANMARVRLNDAIASIGGDIFTDTQPFSLQSVNSAWRRLQEFLSDKGVPALDRETTLSGVLQAATADQGVRTFISWSNYFDGVTMWTTPVLPQDLIHPLELYERPAGSNANYVPMDREFNDLTTAPRQPLNRYWRWQQETIYMPGATSQTQILMRYAGFLADFLPSGNGGGQIVWSSQTVPIMRSASAFAWLLCSEVARARADLDAGWFDQQGFLAAEWIWNRDYRQDRAIYKGAEAGKMPDQDSATKSPTGPRGPQRGNGGAA